MPRYKYVANRVLTAIENRVLGTDLSEMHTGYRAYSRDFLLTVPFLRNAPGFSFDSEMLMQAVHFGFRVREVPARARYFADASSTDLRDSIVYGLKTLGAAAGCAAPLGRPPLAQVPAVSRVTGERVVTADRRLQPDLAAARGGLRRVCPLLPPGRVLDLGCGVGHSYELLAPRETVGVDLDAGALAGQQRETQVADMRALPFADGTFASVLSVQSIEHVPDPERVLAEVARVLEPRGVAVFVTPNRLTFGRPDEVIDPYHYVEYRRGAAAGAVRPGVRRGRALGPVRLRALRRAGRRRAPAARLAAPPRPAPPPARAPARAAQAPLRQARRERSDADPRAPGRSSAGILQSAPRTARAGAGPGRRSAGPAPG